MTSILLSYDRDGHCFQRIARKIRDLLPHCLTDIKPMFSPANIDPDILIAVYWGTDHWDQYPSADRYMLVYDHESWRRMPEKFAERAAQAKQVFVSSEILQSDLPYPSTVMTDGVDTELFSAPPWIPRHDGTLIAGFCGNSLLYEGIKRLDEIKEACYSVERVELRMADPATGNYVDDMPAWYAGIDVLICASRSEGTPNPVLESLAAGRAVVSTKVGVIPALERDGAIIARHTCKDLADTLRALRDDHDTIARMARSGPVAVQHWSWDKVLTPLIQELQLSTVKTPPVRVFFDAFNGTGTDFATASSLKDADIVITTPERLVLRTIERAGSEYHSDDADPPVLLYSDTRPRSPYEMWLMRAATQFAVGVVTEWAPDKDEPAPPKWLGPARIWIAEGAEEVSGEMSVLPWRTAFARGCCPKPGTVPRDLARSFGKAVDHTQDVRMRAQAIEFHRDLRRWELVGSAWHSAIRKILDIAIEPDTCAILVHCDEPCLSMTRHAIHIQKNFGEEIELVEVANITPMDAAFNFMLSRATREYHVQVDADMILYPKAIEILREEIATADPTVWQVCGWLWDDVYERPICGVKIYRSEIARKHQYLPVRHCEMDQVTRLESEGYTIGILPMPPNKIGCLGLHHHPSLKHAYWSSYDRGLRRRWLVAQDREDWFGWLDDVESRLKQRCSDTGDMRFLAAWLGFRDARKVEIPDAKWPEKDANRPPISWENAEIELRAEQYRWMTDTHA